MRQLIEATKVDFQDRYAHALGYVHGDGDVAALAVKAFAGFATDGSTLAWTQGEHLVRATFDGALRTTEVASLSPSFVAWVGGGNYARVERDGTRRTLAVYRLTDGARAETNVPVVEYGWTIGLLTDTELLVVDPSTEAVVRTDLTALIFR